MGKETSHETEITTHAAGLYLEDSVSPLKYNKCGKKKYDFEQNSNHFQGVCEWNHETKKEALHL